jgi:hypothetical protein
MTNASAIALVLVIVTVKLAGSERAWSRRIGASGGAAASGLAFSNSASLHLARTASHVDWHQNTAAAMPRSLARLRFKAPQKPITFANRAKVVTPQYEETLQRRVTQYVERQSNPQHLRLQTVVNEKARRQPTGKRVVAPIKPYTLRDIVDPEGTAKHGEIIYIFRNTQTNQIIYSLNELLDVWHSLAIYKGMN